MSKAKSKGPRKYASGVKIRIGMMGVEGDLYPIQYSPAKPKVSMVAPDGGKVEQVYRAADGTIYNRDQLDRKVESGGEEFTVTEDELKKAKDAALESAKNILSLHVHDADAAQRLFPADSKAYVFKPHTDDPENMQWYSALVGAMRNTDKVFVGEAKLSRSTGFFRVYLWNGHVVVHKHNPPAEVYQYDAIDVEDTPHAEKMVEYLERMSAPFNPEDYTDVMADAVATADEHKEAPKPTATDIGAALDSFLNA